MEFNLRCNALNCRGTLGSFAVVTTCSHIFCIRCAESLLNEQAASSHHVEAALPTCPACHTELKNPDDVVKTNLSPTDDYKTSVLSGLSPNLILEIAGRGIRFWMYQATQEIVYQEYLTRTVTEKFNDLSNQLDNTVHEANRRIKEIETKFQSLTLENKTISRRNHELSELLREKTQKQHDIEGRYDNKFGRKSLVSRVQAPVLGSANRNLNHAFGTPPSTSNGVPRLSGLGLVPPQTGYQGRDGGTGQPPFTERERLTIPSGPGSIERREGSISDGNSACGRRRVPRPRLPMQGRVGSAGAGIWNAGGPRENMDRIMTPLNGLTHRERLGPPNTRNELVNTGYSGTQNWNLEHTKLGVEGGSRGVTGLQRWALNEMPANVVGR